MNQSHVLNGNGDERTGMGFPVIPFALLWPLIKLIAVPLLRAILPWLLERIAESIRSGRPVTFTDAELAQAVDQQQTQMQAVYRGG